MTDRLNLNSIYQFVDAARKNPGILNIASLSVMRDVITKANNTTGGCSRCGNKLADLSLYRPQFDAAMAMLSDGEKSQMKNILAAKQICYYQKNNKGQIKQYCF